MTESFIQLPNDGVGKKQRARQRTIGANTVYEPAYFAGAMPTYYFQTAQQTAAASKVFLDIFNATGSGVVLKLRKLFFASNAATVTFAATYQHDIDRTSAVGTGGTTLTAGLADTADAALPAQVTARAGATGGATKSGTTLFSAWPSPEESQAGAHLAWSINAVPEGIEVREPTIRAGEGIRVFQNGGSTIGSWSILAVITTE